MPLQTMGAFGRAINVDAAGNVYITGESAIFSGGANRALVVKYSPSGTQPWSYLFAYSTAYNGGFDIITDASGNVYVTGEYATNVITYNNIFLVKFGSSGNLINQTFYHSGSEGARKIALDGNGKIIIGGYANINYERFIALKYEQNLDFVWATTWTDSSAISVNDLVVDFNSNIILTGTSNLDYTTIKMNNAGAIQWVKKYNSPTGWDQCRAAVTDNSGNIYITGETGTSGFPLTYKMTTIKYNQNGDTLWVKSYNGGNNPDGYYGYDIAIDNLANVYVTGNISSSSSIATIKYNTAGTFQWSVIYNGPANNIDRGVSVGVDANRNVYTTGYSLGSGTGYDFVAIKHTQLPVMKLNLTALIEGFYSNISNKMIKDTAKVYLRNASSPYALVDSAKSVIDSLGKGTFLFFNSSNGVSRYIEVKHRNSIETWSSSGKIFTNDTLSYDFTTSASKAFGNNEILKGTKYCIYSGDVNQDGTVDISDNQLIDNDAYNFASGYLATDVTGDGAVDIADATIADNNAYNFVSRIRP